MARPLPLSSAEALLFPWKEGMSVSALSLLPLYLICSDTCALPVSVLLLPAAQGKGAGT